MASGNPATGEGLGAGRRGVDGTTLRFLLKRGFDARTVMQPADWVGMGAKAAASGNVWALRYVLEQGVKLDALMSPADLKKVWFDATGSDGALTGLLLKHGYDVNTRDDWGRTALFHASHSYSPRPEVVGVLLEAGITLEEAPAIIAYCSEPKGDKAEYMDCGAIARYLETAVAAAEAKRLAGGAGAPSAV